MGGLAIFHVKLQSQRNIILNEPRRTLEEKVRSRSGNGENFRNAKKYLLIARLDDDRDNNDNDLIILMIVTTMMTR